MVRSKMSWEAAQHPGTKGNLSSKGISRGACQTDRAVSTSQKFSGPSRLSESAEHFSSSNRGTEVRRLLLDEVRPPLVEKGKNSNHLRTNFYHSPPLHPLPHGWLPMESK